MSGGGKVVSRGDTAFLYGRQAVRGQRVRCVGVTGGKSLISAMRELPDGCGIEGRLLATIILLTHVTQVTQRFEINRLARVRSLWG